MSDIQSKIVLRAEGGDQAAQEIRKIQEAFEKTAAASKEMQKKTMGDSFDESIRSIKPPTLPPQPPQPPPPAQPPPPMQPTPPTPPPGRPGQGAFSGAASQILSSGAGSLGGRRSNVMGMGAALPALAPVLGALGGPVGLAVAGGALLAAGAIKAINELAENEMQRVQETFASGIAQRLGAIGDDVRMTIIEEERRGTPTGMVQSFLGTYSRAGGNLESLEEPYLTAQHPDRSKITTTTMLNQISDIMTGFGVEGSILGQLAGRATDEGLDTSRLFGEVNTAIGLQTHGESRLGEFYTNITKLLEQQLESGVHVGQETKDSIVGLQATMKAGGMSADAINKTLEAVTSNLSGKLDDPGQLMKFLSIMKPGESVFETQLRMETVGGEREYLESFVERTSDNREGGMRLLARQRNISLHQARGLYTGFEESLRIQDEAARRSEQYTILRREGVDVTRVEPDDPLAINALTAGVDPETAQRTVQEKVAKQADDIRTTAGDNISILRGLEEGALNLRTGVNLGLGRILGLTTNRFVGGEGILDPTSIGLSDFRLGRGKLGLGALKSGSEHAVTSSSIGLGGSLSDQIFYDPELGISQEEIEGDGSDRFPGGGAPGDEEAFAKAAEAAFYQTQGRANTQVRTIPKVDTRTQPQIDAETKPQPKVQTIPKTGVQTQLEVETDPRLEAEPVLEIETEPQLKVQPIPKLEMYSELEAEHRVQPISKLETEPVVKVETEPQPIPKLYSEAKTEPVVKVEAEPQTRVQPVPKLEMEAEPIPKVQPILKTDTRTQLEVEAQPIPKLYSEAKPSPIVKTEAEPAIQTDIVQEVESVVGLISKIPVAIRESREAVKELSEEAVVVNPEIEPLVETEVSLPVRYQVEDESVVLEPEIETLVETQVSLPVEYVVQESTVILDPEIETIEMRVVGLPVSYRIEDSPVELEPEIEPLPEAQVLLLVKYQVEDSPVLLEPEIEAVESRTVGLPVLYQVIEKPVVLDPDIESPVETQVSLPVEYAVEDEPVILEPEVKAVELQTVDFPVLYRVRDEPVELEPEMKPIDTQFARFSVVYVPQVDDDAIEIAIPEIKPLDKAAVDMPIEIVPQVTVAQPNIMTTDPRGIRNNNPGNIRTGESQWEGMADRQRDPSFVQFMSIEHGIQAMVELFDTYQSKYALATVEEMISRWAPGHENPTDDYIAYVRNRVGSSEIDVDNPEQVQRLIAAVIEFENGRNPYTNEQIQAGMARAREGELYPSLSEDGQISMNTFSGKQPAGGVMAFGFGGSSAPSGGLGLGSSLGGMFGGGSSPSGGGKDGYDGLRRLRDESTDAVGRLAKSVVEGGDVPAEDVNVMGVSGEEAQEISSTLYEAPAKVFNKVVDAVEGGAKAVANVVVDVVDKAVEITKDVDKKVLGLDWDAGAENRRANKGMDSVDVRLDPKAEFQGFVDFTKDMDRNLLGVDWDNPYDPKFSDTQPSASGHFFGPEVSDDPNESVGRSVGNMDTPSEKGLVDQIRDEANKLLNEAREIKDGVFAGVASLFGINRSSKVIEDNTKDSGVPTDE